MKVLLETALTPFIRESFKFFEDYISMDMTSTIRLQIFVGLSTKFCRLYTVTEEPKIFILFKE